MDDSSSRLSTNPPNPNPNTDRNKRFIAALATLIANVAIALGLDMDVEQLIVLITPVIATIVVERQLPPAAM